MHKIARYKDHKLVSGYFEDTYIRRIFHNYYTAIPMKACT